MTDPYAEFRLLWHEGEEPSRPWGTDRRVGSYSLPSTQGGTG